DTVNLLQAIAERPYSFDFFQALRRLEALFADKPRIGKATRPQDEPIRFGQEPSLAFAPSTLASLKLREDRPPRLEVFFFGLFGPNGALPLHLTEHARSRIRNNDDETFARFVDMFHHRLLSLFYRAWASAQPTVSYDRPNEDRFGEYIGSALGIGAPALRDRDAVPDLAKLYYAGLFSNQTHHADGLQAIIADYFQVPVKIQQFVGHWLELSSDSMTRLGESPATGALGVTAVIGSRIWDCQHKFRIIIGPLSYADYRRLLPGGDSLKRLVALVRNYQDDSLSWDLKLILKKDEVPPLQLGQAGELGWTSWSTT
ncbi:MAG: type VI secretion system baseplate subunit TssG, partial [Candidatus Competibacteraceae bacterium]|nr:type VI secretion system baseplate subunit TssG [Candidatus Competibacteraceae bacterium]